MMPPHWVATGCSQMGANATAGPASHALVHPSAPRRSSWPRSGPTALCTKIRRR